MREIKLVILSAFVVLATASSCNYNVCDQGIESWIEEAPVALEEFLLVREEIWSSKELNSKILHGRGLFIKSSDSSKYFKYELPHLNAWLQGDRGYISMNAEHTSLCFKKCVNGFRTANGYIYLEKHHQTYKASVVLVDSVNLGDGWFAHVVKCDGCND